MLGINYESSDEEEEVPIIPSKKPPVQQAKPQGAITSVTKPAGVPHSTSSSITTPLNGPTQGAAQGPTQGPTSIPLNATEESAVEDENAQGSPYTAARAMIRNLTLPTVPNFDIPSSPPGSPPQISTKKFAQFLDLKKKGQHFNQRLENSPVIRDPNHGQKLMNFARITTEQQYASTLPADLAIPSKFPEWAYVEKLTASQKQITKAKEEANAKTPRESIDFVAATHSGLSSATGTPSSKVSRQSGAERVMAGMEKGHEAKRKELEQRGGRNDASGSRWGARSRSPKRRRSRSRERR